VGDPEQGRPGLCLWGASRACGRVMTVRKVPAKTRPRAGAAALVGRRFRGRDHAGEIPSDFVAVRAIQVPDFARAFTMRAPA